MPRIARCVGRRGWFRGTEVSNTVHVNGGKFASLQSEKEAGKSFIDSMLRVCHEWRVADLVRPPDFLALFGSRCVL